MKGFKILSLTEFVSARHSQTPGYAKSRVEVRLKMSGRNGYFQLINKDDGLYLKIVDAELGGQPVIFDEINRYLSDVKIYDYDKIAVGRALGTIKDIIEVKLTPTLITPQNERFIFDVSENRLYVQGRFYPPMNKGTLLSKEDIVQTLTQAGIKYGIDEAAINLFIKDRKYCTDYILAKGAQAVQGKDAVITYHFNTDLSHKPRTNEDGSVDFHHLDTISHCRKGDLLATLVPADPGIPGTDVFGNTIRPNRVVNRVLRHGNNIHVSEDGLQMFSDVDGHVALTDDRVFVSDTYNIPADVGASTGDVDYDGNVLVKGNVLTGYTVKARGDIEVLGVVEGAYLEAGGQIVLRRGMQGMNKGILKANSNIVSKFIENAEVIAGGYVSTESIMHSNVSALGDIIVGGKRGFVSGCKLKSGTMISVKTAGSDMGSATLLEVGIDPRISEEFRELEKELTIMAEEKEKLIQALNMLRKRITPGAPVSKEIREILKQVTQKNVQLEAQTKVKKSRYEALRAQMENNTSGIIKVQDTIHPGTKIVISNVTYYVKDAVQHSRFVRDRADIKIIPY